MLLKSDLESDEFKALSSWSYPRRCDNNWGIKPHINLDLCTMPEMNPSTSFGLSLRELDSAQHLGRKAVTNSSGLLSGKILRIVNYSLLRASRPTNQPTNHVHIGQTQPSATILNFCATADEVCTCIHSSEHLCPQREHAASCVMLPLRATLLAPCSLTPRYVSRKKMMSVSAFLFARKSNCL
eukprot:TRINITY_DN14829_c0_g1_i1.p1 TRINITY_DN14829_c0_g1~~TRINITY_DN14829_c0_g1_i1.p1  ORF type:complete len:183 (+),score=5.89 TRINITY_DN14829_c0_g1_i1:118-666(+)